MKAYFRRISIFLLLALSIVGGTWYLEMARQETPTGTPEDTGILMRNLSWGTSFEPFTPYKKNDELEFVFVTPSDSGDLASVDVSRLRDLIDITEIQADHEPIKESELDSIPVSGALTITVRGKARENTVNKTDLNGLVKIRFSRKKPVTDQSLEKPVITGSGARPASLNIPSYILSSNIDNLIPISGEHLDTIDRVVVGEKSFQGSMKWDVYYFILPRNTFGSWDYFVGLYLKNGELIASGKKLSFTYDSSPINIAAITPSTIKNDKDGYVVVQGNGFSKMVSLQLSNNLIFKSAQFTVVNDQVVSIKIPKWLDPGEYTFNMMDTTWIYEAKNKTLTVTQ